MKTLAVLSLVVSAALAACGSDGGDAPPGTPFPDPTELTGLTGAAEDVLSQWVVDRLGQGFVANCEDAQRPDDIGKVCVSLLAQRDGRLAYQMGPTFSEFTRLFVLEPREGAWAIIYEASYSGEVTSIPWPLAVGAQVIVSTESDCLQVRDEPGLAAVPIDCLDNGTEVVINAGPTERDAFTWWRLEGLGWVAGEFLAYPLE